MFSVTLRRVVVFLPLALALGFGLRATGERLATLVEARAAAAAQTVALALATSAGAPDATQAPTRWADIETDGLVLTVRGQEPHAGEAALLVSTLSRALPRARVIDETAPARPSPTRAAPMQVDLLRAPGGVTITGSFAGSALRAELLDLIARALPAVPVHDLSGLDAGVQPMHGAELAVAVRALEAMTQSAVRIEPAHVEVAGNLPSRGASGALEADLMRIAGPGLALSLALRVPRRPIDPFRLVLARDATGLQVIACAARDESEAETLEAAFAASGIAEATCEIGTGGPSLDWTRGALSGLATLDGLPAGRFTLSGRFARLEAPAGTEEAVFRAAMAGLAAALPAGFTLTGSVAEGGGRDVAEGRLWFQARREGPVLGLAGRIAGTAERRVLTALAASTLGTDRIDYAGLQPLPPRLVEDSGVDAAGFHAAAKAAVALLATGDRGGTVTVIDRAVVIALQVDHAEDAAQGLSTLTAALPPGYRLSSEVTVDLPGAMARLPLSEDRCASALNEAVTARPISFDPGSTRLDDDSGPRLDAMARILARCSGARIEVGGHTDNQGRATMNLRLSRARAEAVVAALTERGITPAQALLIARGYGEEEPVAPNDSDAGRALNRRIAFRASPPSDLSDAAAEGGSQ
ncbi:MAG: OmpA family protein [Pseudomonadota bacterium]